ncbi:MAG TPA: polyhydroxyalkanoate depolymerase, partial [Polyangiales bacterium]
MAMDARTLAVSAHARLVARRVEVVFMFYPWIESQRAMLRPFVELASASATMLRHPLSVFAQLPLSREVAATLDLTHRIHKAYDKPAFAIADFAHEGAQVAVREEAVLELPFCRLLRFRRYCADVSTLHALDAQPKVLVVAPLSGHYATLLRDTVTSLVRDHDVYITDWTNAKLVPLAAGAFSLDDYVDYVKRFVRTLGERAHVIAVCQPAVPVLGAVALLAADGDVAPRSMTLMGGPVDARCSPTSVNELATKRSLAWFETHMVHRVPVGFPGVGRRVYPGFLQHACFIAMNPDRHAGSHRDYFFDLLRDDHAAAHAHRDFYDEYNAVLDMAAEYYLGTVHTVFQEFELARGTWRVAGQRVQPGRIERTALLTIEGEHDDITGIGQTAAAHRLCTGIADTQRAHHEIPGAGHYGIFSGRRFRETVYPMLRAFIASHTYLAASTVVSVDVARSASQRVAC